MTMGNCPTGAYLLTRLLLDFRAELSRMACVSTAKGGCGVHGLSSSSLSLRSSYLLPPYLLPHLHINFTTVSYIRLPDGEARKLFAIPKMGQ